MSRPRHWSTPNCGCYRCTIRRANPNDPVPDGYWQAWLAAHYQPPEQATAVALAGLSAVT